MKAIRFVLLAFAVVGCSQSIADHTGRIPPLNELSNVHLGMRAYSLRRARPNAVASPYFGFRERVGSGEFMYEVPGSVEDGQAPPWWEPLQSVVVMERFDRNANVRALWQTSVKRIAASIGAPPKCYAFSTADREGWLATWPRGNDELFVAGQTTVHSADESFSGTIATGVARQGHGLGRVLFAPSTLRPCNGLITQ